MLWGFTEVSHCRIVDAVTGAKIGQIVTYPIGMPHSTPEGVQAAYAALHEAFVDTKSQDSNLQ